MTFDNDPGVQNARRAEEALGDGSLSERSSAQLNTLNAEMRAAQMVRHRGQSGSDLPGSDFIITLAQKVASRLGI